MAEDTRVGTELAGYRIEGVIGRGGMSVVYLAEHARLERKVALKVLAPELAGSERFHDRFLRESKLAASIDHPNIVPIYDADEAEGVLYIAMRYVEGSDLKQAIRDHGPARTSARVGDRRPGRERPRCRSRSRARPSRREAGERPAHPRRPRVRVGLRPDEAGRVGERAHGDGPAHRDDRLRRAGTDQGRSRRPARRRLFARVSALRMPDRACSLPARHRGGRAVGARRDPAAVADGGASRPPARGRRRRGPRDGQGPCRAHGGRG